MGTWSLRLCNKLPFYREMQLVEWSLIGRDPLCGSPYNTELHPTSFLLLSERATVKATIIKMTNTSILQLYILFFVLNILFVGYSAGDDEHFGKLNLSDLFCQVYGGFFRRRGKKSPKKLTETIITDG